MFMTVSKRVLTSTTDAREKLLATSFIVEAKISHESRHNSKRAASEPEL
jgi:hypothetical protein